MRTTVYADWYFLNRRLETLGKHATGSLFIMSGFCETTQNVILSTTGVEVRAVILLSNEDIKKVIEILEVLCEEI